MIHSLDTYIVLSISVDTHCRSIWFCVMRRITCFLRVCELYSEDIMGNPRIRPFPLPADAGMQRSWFLSWWRHGGLAPLGAVEALSCSRTTALPTRLRSRRFLSCISFSGFGCICLLFRLFPFEGRVQIHRSLDFFLWDEAEWSLVTFFSGRSTTSGCSSWSSGRSMSESSLSLRGSFSIAHIRLSETDRGSPRSPRRPRPL